jgi:AraC family transcriptional regulator
MIANLAVTSEQTRTMDLTIGHVRLVEHTWPADARAPAEHNQASHICFLVEGGFEERRGRSRVWRVAPHLRASPVGDAHACCYGHAGGRCVVIEALPARDEQAVPAPTAPVFVADPRMVDLAVRIYGEVPRHGPRTASPLVVESLTLELMAQVSRWERPRASRRPPPWLARVRDLLAETLADPPDLATLACVAGVHRVNVARAFRDHFGCSVGEHVRRLRVERARALLTGTDVSLVEVALRSGYFDQSHMTRSVARYLGDTPATIRRTSRGQNEQGNL